ncbi:MAG: hypothetical protein ONB13_13025 [candidate division KSB1 bacterium]|nr:hypothetical protein [candidate division KSB1 bacterium]MDZ7333641.1 hypothetical protein [candidate division KSB1 bacterium]MDZ7358128.1 hypothetical protein [candidate division KSB1 bacterium]MDZ7377527.1 hypothetical protein [candidate division KSB1 bacterium]MDZ7398755.1 hypothetical protein [candidate division KSB1 bacterium]
MIDDLVPLAFFIAVAYVIKLLSDNKIRRLAIEKGLLNENMKYLFLDRFEGKVPASLKWGFVLVGIGLAFFVGQMAPRGAFEEVTIGAMFFFAGLGLIVYYFVAKRIYSKAKEEEKNSSQN